MFSLRICALGTRRLPRIACWSLCRATGRMESSRRNKGTRSLWRTPRPADLTTVGFALRGANDSATDPPRNGAVLERPTSAKYPELAGRDERFGFARVDRYPQSRLRHQTATSRTRVSTVPDMLAPRKSEPGTFTQRPACSGNAHRHRAASTMPPSVDRQESAHLPFRALAQDEPRITVSDSPVKGKIAWVCALMETDSIRFPGTPACCRTEGTLPTAGPGGVRRQTQRALVGVRNAG